MKDSTGYSIDVPFIVGKVLYELYLKTQKALPPKGARIVP